MTNDAPWAQQLDAILAALGRIHQRIDRIEDRLDDMVNDFSKRHDDLRAQIDCMQATLDLHHGLFEAITVAGSKGDNLVTLADIKTRVLEACGAAAETGEPQRINVKTDTTTITTLVRPHANPAAVLLNLCERL